MTVELPGRTDNSLLQRYRRLMIWKQQCETFFAMPVCRALGVKP